MRTAIGTAAVAMLLAFPVQLALAAGGNAMFPTELHGVWDMHPWPCRADEASDSDMRFLIEGGSRRNYEDTDTLLAVQQLATDPRTWRVVATSSLDPSDTDGEAQIYVLAGDTLAVTDGKRAEVYVRCR